MSSAYKASLWRRPGESDLELYSRLGSGMSLFRAYLSRRKASKPIARARHKELKSAMDAAAPIGREYFEAFDELIMLDTLEHLDQVVADLLKFCEKPGPTDGQLRKLRTALQIDRGRSPHDVALAERREKGIARWRAAHRLSTLHPKSDATIARQIAKTLKVSQRTAWSYLEELKQRDPSYPAQLQDRSANTRSALAEFERMVARMRRRIGLGIATPSPPPKGRPRFQYGKQKRAND